MHTDTAYRIIYMPNYTNDLFPIYRVLQHIRELKEVKYVEVDQVSAVLSANKMTLIV